MPLRISLVGLLVLALSLSAAGGAPGARDHGVDSTGVTVMVRDLLPGPNSGMGTETFHPGMFAAVDGTLYFKAIVGADSGATYGYQLVRSDGTFSGTEPVAIVPSSLSGTPEVVATSNGTIFYSMTVFGSPVWQLWKSDGTESGTSMVKEFPIWHGDEGHFKVVGSTVYFLANDGVHGIQMLKSEGTEAGTTMVSDDGESDFTIAGDTTYFLANNQLWRTDGTPGGTIALTTPSAGTASTPHAVSIQDLVAVGDTLFFSADDGTHGDEIWKSDGTGAGTMMVKDIVPGILGSLPRYITSLDGSAVFAAGNGLWRSDGTAAGTTLVSQAQPTSADDAVVGGYLYYAGDDGVHGVEPWRTDGTPDGTTMLGDIAPGDSGSLPAWFTDLGGIVFFAANDDVNGDELWKTDGTVSGTTMVADIAPGGAGSGPSALFPLGNTLFFIADDQTHGYELWKTTVPDASIAGFTPTLGPAGTTVTVSGKSLGEPTGVSVNGVHGNVTAASDKSLKFEVPSDATSGRISVSTTLGTSVSSTSFRVIHAPGIFNVSPMSGGPGSTVTITGTDLDVAEAVTLGGQPVPFVAPTPTRLAFTIPSGASSGTIAVRNPGGVTATSTPFVVPPAPIIAGFSPAVGATGTSVTVTGSNLGTTMAVVVGRGTARPIIVSGGELTFTVPSGATSGPIELLASKGASPAAISGATFTVISTPRIVRLAPTTARPGGSVTAVGTGFYGVTSVTLDGRSLPFVIHSSGTLTFTVPAGAQSGLIAITSPAGTTTARLTISR